MRDLLLTATVMGICAIWSVRVAAQVFMRGPSTSPISGMPEGYAATASRLDADRLKVDAVSYAEAATTIRGNLDGEALRFLESEIDRAQGAPLLAIYCIANNLPSKSVMDLFVRLVHEKKDSWDTVLVRSLAISPRHDAKLALEKLLATPDTLSTPAFWLAVELLSIDGDEASLDRLKALRASPGRTNEYYARMTSAVGMATEIQALPPVDAEVRRNNERIFWHFRSDRPMNANPDSDYWVIAERLQSHRVKFPRDFLLSKLPAAPDNFHLGPSAQADPAALAIVVLARQREIDSVPSLMPLLTNTELKPFVTAALRELGN